MRLLGELVNVQRGQDHPEPGLLVPGLSQRGTDPRRGASQMEQRGAPAEFRKVQQPQVHWVWSAGMEPEEKLQTNTNPT